MPSSVTHSYFAMDVYEKLPKYCTEKIQDTLGYYKLFAQGSDPFMFYHFFLGKKAKMVAQIQTKMHYEKTRDFFLSIIYFIDKHGFVNHSEVMSYLYGYICHYYLDLFTHPFLYYKSGVFDPKNKNTYQYNGLHQEIEYRIDSYFIEKREKIDPKKFRMDKFIFEVDKFSKELEDVMEESIGMIYEIKKVVPIYYRSIWYMQKFFRIANYDPWGIKRKIYQWIDKISPNGMIRLEELSYYNTYLEESYYLNLIHKKWNLPWDPSQVFSSSFLDLYDMALQQAVLTIQEVTIMLEQKKLNEKRLREIFANLSFSTGLDCNKHVTMKYFEF